jgi:outer membrane protein assembly factor BamA
LIINVVEGRVVLYKWLTGAVFFDGGKVWAELSDFSFKNVQWSIGPGIMANTALGLLRLDYGVQLHKSPRGRVLFSVGLPF